MFRSSNPVFARSESVSSGVQQSTGVMTLKGTIDKVFLLLGIALITATYIWQMSMPSQPLLPGQAMGIPPLAWFGGIGGFICALVTIFKPSWAAISAPLYAAFEGLLLGGLTAFAEVMYPGIAIQALLGTFAVFFGMLTLYRSGVIAVTDRFRKIVLGMGMGIFGIYLLSFVMGLFGAGVPFIHSAGPIGIGFSVIVVGVAALFLVLDFDNIQQAVSSRAPKEMEWYMAFGLMVTIVWLYIEILKLLMKLRSSD